MKKILSGLVTACLLLSTLFTSCKKDDKKNELVFTINGVSDQSYTGSSITIPLGIGYTSGNQESVTMSVSGLPSGMTGTFSSQSGTPSFTTTLTIANTGTITAGSYVVTITGTSTSGVTKSASMKLTIPDDCSYSMLGQYEMAYEYMGTSYDYGPVTAFKSDLYANTLSVKDESANEVFLVTLNCSNGTCSVPGGTDSYTGNYTTSPRKIVLNYSDGSSKVIFTAK
ncbi:MAG: hypothetical protein QM743_02225 [Chitinophagaceae bacterium]